MTQTKIFYYCGDEYATTGSESACLCGVGFNNIVSNNAAAVIGTPIAITIAQSLGVQAEAFVSGVLFGAN